MRQTHLCILGFVIVCLSCAAQSDDGTSFYYDLKYPDEIFKLPPILKEVSGLTMDGDTLYCVQDERGEIFQYDLKRKEIASVIPFGEEGDYEGIAIAGSVMYILSSRGNLYEFSKEKSTQRLNSLDIDKECDAEGICYDKENQRLLLACKGASSKPGKTKSIYSFGLDDRKIEKIQSLSFSLDDIKNASNWISLDRFEQYEEEWKGLETYNPSGIAIHPKTGYIYILSSKGKFLLVLDSFGKIDCLTRLDPSLFRQPEGITFDSANNLYISNEGQVGAATIYFFRYNTEQ